MVSCYDFDCSYYRYMYGTHHTKNLQGYSIDIMRQSACLVINPIRFCSYGTSDSWLGLKLSDDPDLKLIGGLVSLVVGLVAFLSFDCISYELFSLSHHS